MITSHSLYTSELNRSLEDKLYCQRFLTPCDLIVDFGCADGTLLFTIGEALEEAFLVGYDTNPQMLRLAMVMQPANTLLTRDWDDVSSLVKKAKCPGIILSSVLHEVYDQGLQNEVWERIADFSIVCIRDMCVKDSLATQSCLPECAALIGKLFPKQVADYVAVWGAIYTEHDLLHFLMKYRYEVNWTHEVRENYFGLTWDELIRRIDQLPRDFHVERMYHFQHQYTADRINRDTGINISHKTHIECVISRL